MRSLETVVSELEARIAAAARDWAELNPGCLLSLQASKKGGIQLSRTDCAVIPPALDPERKIDRIALLSLQVR